MRIPIGAIVGPTATGKSEIGIEVAGLLEGEIVSVDSMQVYRGMDIGTAKVGYEERLTKDGKYIQHHMLDIVEPDEDYSVGRFQEEAAKVIQDIYGRKKLPILVGGTGLYFNALVYEYEFTPGKQDTQLRTELWEEAETFGSEHLHRKLQQVDPKSAESIHPNDTKRVIRALEVYQLTGKRISETSRNRQGSYNLAAAGLDVEREVLYRRVDLRVDRMLEQGLIEEVRGLLDQGIIRDSISMQALGYKEVAGYLLGEYDLDTCVEMLKRDTRRFAKRQLTWFKRDENIKWFRVDDYDNREQVVESIASYFRMQLQI